MFLHVGDDIFVNFELRKKNKQTRQTHNQEFSEVRFDI